MWLWLLACQWRRIDQEEPFVGRAAEVGDTIGSTVLAARLVRDVIRLCFLLERQYAPYAKWLGTRFRELDAHDRLDDALLDVLSASDYTAREDALVRTLQAAAALRNERGATRPVDESVGRFHGRPFKVLGSGRFVDACLERVTDPRLAALPLVGGIDQLADSADLLSGAQRTSCGAPPVRELVVLGRVRRGPQARVSFAIGCSAATTFAMCSSSSSPRKLGACVHLVPVDARREGRLLQLLLDGFRLEAVEPGRPHEAAGVDEPGELVAGEQRLLERRVARHGEVLGVREHGLDQLLRVALVAEDRGAVLGVLVERGVDLVVEVVEERGGAPEAPRPRRPAARTSRPTPRRRARAGGAPRSSCSA